MGEEAFRLMRRMLAPSRQRVGRDCGADNCVTRTREGKPYCPSHVLMHAYVQQVLAGMDKRDEQVEGLGKQGPDPQMLIGEVIQLLQQLGGCTLEGAAKHMHITREQMGHLASLIKRRKIITLFKNKRGLWVMELL